jgi:hypothetical protein
LDALDFFDVEQVFKCDRTAFHRLRQRDQPLLEHLLHLFAVGDVRCEALVTVDMSVQPSDGPDSNGAPEC